MKLTEYIEWVKSLIEKIQINFDGIERYNRDSVQGWIAQDTIYLKEKPTHGIAHTDLLPYIYDDLNIEEEDARDDLRAYYKAIQKHHFMPITIWRDNSKLKCFINIPNKPTDKLVEGLIYLLPIGENIDFTCICDEVARIQFLKLCNEYLSQIEVDSRFTEQYRITVLRLQKCLEDLNKEKKENEPKISKLKTGRDI